MFFRKKTNKKQSKQEQISITAAPWHVLELSSTCFSQVGTGTMMYAKNCTELCTYVCNIIIYHIIINKEINVVYIYFVYRCFKCLYTHSCKYNMMYTWVMRRTLMTTAQNVRWSAVIKTARQQQGSTNTCSVEKASRNHVWKGSKNKVTNLDHDGLSILPGLWG